MPKAKKTEVELQIENKSGILKFIDDAKCMDCGRKIDGIYKRCDPCQSKVV